MTDPRHSQGNENLPSDAGDGLITPLITPSSKVRKRDVDDAREYAIAVKASAEVTAARSLYPRNHFSQFAQYLQYIFEDNPSKPTSNVSDHAFATLYDLRSKEDPKHISTVSEFEALAANTSEKSNRQILFLRGLPSPDWLCAIGAAYKIDPDFFRRHIDFRPALGRSSFFSDPYLPSASTTMYRLLLTTIGEVPHGDQREIEKLRDDSSKLMKAYMDALKYDEQWRLGDSIVRHFDLFESTNHEPAHYTIEQEVSVCIQKTEHSCMCVVWLDLGRNLSDGVKGPWNSLFNTTPHLVHHPYYPVVQRRPNIALKPTSRIAVPLQDPGSEMGDSHTKPLNIGQASTMQSASLLHMDYGRDLDRHLAASNSFYALHDVFAFAGASELQFLNMMGCKVKQETSAANLTRLQNPTITTLLRYKDTIKRHRDRVKESLDSLENSCITQTSSQISTSGADPVMQATELLERDYRFLLSSADNLLADCNSGIQIMMNNSVLHQSQKAISQAQEVAKLTLLAFFYIPLSFTSAFFGMNLSLFGSGKIPVWTWFVVSVPVLAFSLLFLLLDIPALVRQAWRHLRGLGRKRKSAKSIRIARDHSELA